LKTWGAALTEHLKTQDAQSKYDEALTHAPDWRPLGRSARGGARR
jgi:hypothetical protein